MAARKDECSGCGKCCLHAICHFAWWILGVDPKEERCPHLIHKDDRYWCAAVLDEETSEIAKKWLKIGKGCGQKEKPDEGTVQPDGGVQEEVPG